MQMAFRQSSPVLSIGASWCIDKFIEILYLKTPSLGLSSAKKIAPWWPWRSPSLTARCSLKCWNPTRRSWTSNDAWFLQRLFLVWNTVETLRRNWKCRVNCGSTSVWFWVWNQFWSPFRCVFEAGSRPIGPAGWLSDGRLQAAVERCDCACLGPSGLVNGLQPGFHGY